MCEVGQANTTSHVEGRHHASGNHESARCGQPRYPTRGRRKRGRHYGHAKCPKFNLVGTEEIDNLSLAQMIADAQGKELIYEMTDFHTSRPGHDLRYALDGGLLKELGWEPKIKLSERIKEMVQWTLENDRWLRK